MNGVYNAGFGTLGMWDVPKDQPLVESFRFWVGRSRSTPAVITDARAFIRKVGSDVNIVTLTPTDGMTINGQIVTMEVSQVRMNTLVLGSFDLEVQATMDYGARGQLRAVINVIEGLG